MPVTKRSLRSTYAKYHECRVRLLLSGMITESESGKAKERIEKWAENNGLVSVRMQIAENKKALQKRKAS